MVVARLRPVLTMPANYLEHWHVVNISLQVPEPR